MRVSLAAILFLCLVPLLTNGQDVWEMADIEITRLAPSSFVELPEQIVDYLERRNCLVPQTVFETNPHNVIRGQFARLGQFDWAVLCSVNRTSSILIFWRGSVRSVSEIGKRPDGDFLQGIDGEGTIGFSRSIFPVDKGYIHARYQEYGGPKPPQTKHEGINDAFVEKASHVHYYYRGRWKLLQGAD
jgi:hypothetical protein